MACPGRPIPPVAWRLRFFNTHSICCQLLAARVPNTVLRATDYRTVMTPLCRASALDAFRTRVDWFALCRNDNSDIGR